MRPALFYHCLAQTWAADRHLVKADVGGPQPGMARGRQPVDRARRVTLWVLALLGEAGA
jgi:hypothetical protein